MSSRKLLESFSLDASTYYRTTRWVACEPFPFEQADICGVVRLEGEMGAEHYVEMWTEAVLSFLGDKKSRDSVWVVGGEPRPLFRQLFFRVVSVLASRPIQKLVTSVDGLVTRASISQLVTTQRALAGIYIGAPLSGSGHNGLFLLQTNGSLASRNLMKDILENSRALTGYHFVQDMEFPIDQIASYGFKVDSQYLYVTICDAVKLYADYMETIFDFTRIKKMLEGKGHYRSQRVLIDCMNAAGGPFAVEVFEERLGLPRGSVLNSEPSEELFFPNLLPCRRRALLDKMRVERWDAGFALDISAERTMVLGTKGYRVSPGDAAAVLAAHLHCIPYFQRRGVLGLARTITLDPSIDRVAASYCLPLIKTPVGAGVMFDLIQEDVISFFADENYGYGSPHLLAKDGIWGVLAWLSVLTHLDLNVVQAVTRHWDRYGKCFSVRMDYLGVDYLSGAALLAAMERRFADPRMFGTTFGQHPHEYVLLRGENFTYCSPYDDLVIEKCGIVLEFECGSRLICRMSSSQENVLRVYLEHYSSDPKVFFSSRVEMTKPLLDIALQLTGIDEITTPGMCQNKTCL